MYFLLIYLIIFSSFVSFFLGTFLGSFIVIFNLFFLLLSLFLTNIVFYETLLCNFSTNVRLGNWFYSFDIYFNFELFFDQLSTTMLYVILIVSFFVHFFSVFYIKFDPNYNKFFSYLSLFTLFMSIMVLSNNLVQFFLGWEGIGLCSYLLINFWSTRLEANKSAIKALVLNKIGDCFLYLFFIFYYFIFDSFDLNFVQLLSLNFNNFYFFYFNISIYDFMTFLLILASIAKSAQLGLHVWLPDAMEGPTPVSSLLHAATMVTAGVYLLLRLSWILDLSNFNYLLVYIGCFTNFFTSITSMFQFDIKKIIAYSTASQIAIMFIAIGSSMFNLGFFHLFNHAFFKALLFISAGVVIHNYRNWQDLRNFNLIFFDLKFTYIIVLLGNLTLSGFSFLSSYYSKDLIIQALGSNLSTFLFFSFNFSDISIVLTIIYVFKSLNFSFFDNFSYNNFFNNIKFDKNINVYFTLFFLTFLSIFSGYFFSDIFFNQVNHYFKNIFFFDFFLENESFYFLEYTDIFIIFFSIIGFYIGYNLKLILEFFKLIFNRYNYNIFILFCKKWFFDTIYYYFVILFLNFIFDFFCKFVDKILYDFSLNKNLIFYLKNNSLFFSNIQTGQIHFYFFIILMFFIFFIFLFSLLQFFFVNLLFILFEIYFFKNNNG